MDSRIIRWKTDTVEITLKIGSDGVVRLAGLGPVGTANLKVASAPETLLPLTEIRLAGEGNATVKGPSALIDSAISSRLKYKRHTESISDTLHELEVISHDEASCSVEVTVIFSVVTGIPVVRSKAIIRNLSEQDIVVTQISPFTLGGLCGQNNWWDDYILSMARNTGFQECRWSDCTLPSIGLDDSGLREFPECGAATPSTFSLSSSGTRSTGRYLPMGLLKKRDESESWLWQIEHNGSWTWEIGDLGYDLYLALCGANRFHHNCEVHISPKESFTTVPVAVLHLFDGQDAAFAAMTRYRRHIRIAHQDHNQLPVIFNDYMNCLNGDPTEGQIRCLIEPAIYANAEYFVIDAGWYADNNGWWDEVGTWKPSSIRFPSGFEKLIQHIKARGLIPGLWLEPEVVGVRSPLAKQLDPAMFFQDHGRLLNERNRYHFDFRHKAVCDRLDQVIDRLISDYDIGYFKFDYNIENVTGTTLNTRSPGYALLQHNRAYSSWVAHIYQRYPTLVIESCAGGGSRMDYATLAVHQLQSTSDQQNPLLYAAIAASAPTAIAPEQCAIWSYPNTLWTPERIAFTVVNSLLGRIQLSGRIDLLSNRQLDLVRQGTAAYQGTIRQYLKAAVPFWPLGLPGWRDEWLALGMATENIAQNGIFVSIWRRPSLVTRGRSQLEANEVNVASGSRIESDRCLCPLKALMPVKKQMYATTASSWHIQLVYPGGFEASSSLDWQHDNENTPPVLEVHLPPTDCARLFWIQPS